MFLKLIFPILFFVLFNSTLIDGEISKANFIRGIVNGLYLFKRELERSKWSEIKNNLETIFEKNNLGKNLRKLVTYRNVKSANPSINDILHGNNHPGLIYFAERIISLVNETKFKNHSKKEQELFIKNLSEEVREQLTKPLFDIEKMELKDEILENIENFLKIVKPKNIEKSIECLLETLGFADGVPEVSVEYEASFKFFKGTIDYHCV